jgi:signal transduction histidine kinase/DNA-binding response OmpR family regulator
LVKINPNDYSVIKVYNQTDGLQDDQFFTNACFRDQSGEMYFGGPNGLTLFNPDSIKDYKFVPPVVITDFKLFNKSENFAGSKLLSKNISETKEITLKYSQNVLTFDFVALNFVEPEKNQYAYKLEGFEKEWNVSVNKREATYTNLLPGNYTFRVKASNNDGVWNEQGASIKIKVLPPFLLSIWAFVIYALIIAAALFQYKRNIQNREELKRNLALEQMEAAKQIEMNNVRLRFFTNISHEFRTSLSLIIGPAETMINKNQNFSSEQKQQVSLIRQSAQRLLRLINQLLDLRKIEAGNLQIYPSPGDLISFCKDIAKSFEYLAVQKHIDFSVISDQCALYAWFDADKIEKIVYNLLSNAFKFTDDGGKIELTLEVLNRATSISKSIQIKVSDNGIGIPEESINKVFERFYQVESPNQVGKGGTGIGLSLVKELVDIHGGNISIHSIERNRSENSACGTTFTVILPLDIRKNIEESTKTEDYSVPTMAEVMEIEPSENPINPLILVVEDNADLRAFISSILNINFRIIEAENGITGLKAALDHNPDLIISDIMMPGMQGTELCRMLKNDERTSHIPVILLTALSSIEQKIQGFELGADDYITKPFNGEMLKTRIANLIDNRRLIRERFSKRIAVEPKDIAITSVDEKFIARGIDVIERHMDDSLFDVEVFTKEMNVSRTLLHTKLKALTGLSATEFIKSLRLKRAAKLLSEGQLSVSEVSVMVGFNSRNYFTKCFTELFGVSPSEYEKVG